MNSNKIIYDFRNKIKNDEFYFNSTEEYFYVLGQYVVFVFEILGGRNKYKNEFNFLTNPYIPQDIKTIANRNLKFLINTSKIIIPQNNRFYKIYKALIDNRRFIEGGLNERSSDAFFLGLHHDNLFIRFFKEQKTG